MTTPKSKEEAQRRLDKLKDEYIEVRLKNPKRAKAVAREIYALQEWQVRNK